MRTIASFFTQARERLSTVIFPVVGICLVGYFAWHVVQGERGIRAWYDHKSQVRQAEQTLAALTYERESLEHRVTLLRVDSLDPDLLEERARIMLNFGQPTDLIISKESAR